MSKSKTVAITSLMLFMLGACSVMESKKMTTKASAGVSATDCFAAGGTIASSAGASMCKMKDGSSKPIR